MAKLKMKYCETQAEFEERTFIPYHDPFLETKEGRFMLEMKRREMENRFIYLMIKRDWLWLKTHYM